MLINSKGRHVQLPLSRHGQALVEFAIISFVLTAMLAGFLGLIVLGLGSFQNNIAAENVGRLLDRKLPPDLVTAEAVYDQLETAGLYSERYLVIASNDWFSSTFRDSLPELNRSLIANYVYDPDLDAYRYPGAVVTNDSGEQTVLIPLLPDASTGATRGIDRSFNVGLGDVPVSEDWVGPLSISRVDETAYRVVIFYPSQPGSMLNLEVVRDAEGRIVSQTPVEADDSSLSLSAPPNGYTLAPPAIDPNVDASTSRGTYGLGETYAFLKKVRPYRRVFESAAIFRLAETEPDPAPDPAPDP